MTSAHHTSPQPDGSITAGSITTRFRGEQVWIGDVHVANLRLSPDQLRPVVVQALDGSICFEARSRRTAEVWVKLHIAELLDSARNIRRQPAGSSS